MSRDNSASCTAATPIPNQVRFTHQIIKHWKSFQILQKILEQTFTSSVFTGHSATSNSLFLQILGITDLERMCPSIDVYVYVV
jgi:hypothetical protein